MKNTTSQTLIADTPELVNGYRLLALKGMLKMECLGMKGRGRSAYSTIKSEFGFKGSKQSVFDQYVTYLKSINVLSA